MSIKHERIKALEAVRAGRRICKCECGGNVYGSETAGYIGSWCDRCTPVVRIKATPRVMGRDA